MAQNRDEPSGSIKRGVNTEAPNHFPKATTGSVWDLEKLSNYLLDFGGSFGVSGRKNSIYMQQRVIMISCINQTTLLQCLLQ